MKDFISKNKMPVILIILLLISFYYNFKLKGELDKILTIKNINGTYILENQHIHDPEYFVFMEGKFYRYKQFQLLDEGTYEKIYDNVYILKSHNIDECIVFCNESFYFYDRSINEILLYSKTSHIPTFMNLKI
ncbi:MAG: hypothetical protein GX069_10835 [Tissierellia bacterium]|nr:hypothetical protein [Tissierellia bacterium]